MWLDGTSHYLERMVHFVRSQAFVLKCYNTLGEEGHWREKARPEIGSFDFFSWLDLGGLVLRSNAGTIVSPQIRVEGADLADLLDRMNKLWGCGSEALLPVEPMSWVSCPPIEKFAPETPAL